MSFLNGIYGRANFIKINRKLIQKNVSNEIKFFLFLHLQIKLKNYSYKTMKINFLFAAALLFSISIGVKAQQMPADYVQVNELGETTESKTESNDREVVALPYSDGFENGLGGWTRVGCETYTGITTEAYHSGTHSFMFRSTYYPPQYLISPELAETENGLSVQFYYKNYLSDKPESFRVGYSTTTEDLEAFYWDDIVTISNMSWTVYEHVFPAGVKYVAIQCLSFHQAYLYLDDFLFAEHTGCPQPSAPSISEVTTNSVALNWTGNNDSYELKYNKFRLSTFEDGFNGWTAIDADGDGYCWKWNNYNNYFSLGYLSYNYVYSESYDNGWKEQYGDLKASGHPLSPNNYLVSPLVPLGGSITFFARGVDGFDFREHFGVAVSTTGNSSAADFTTIREWTATEGWLKYTVDLSAYSGMGYVAIRHFNCRNQLQLAIDDVTIEFPQLTTIGEIAEESYVVQGLEQGSSYVFWLRGNCGTSPTAWSVPLYVTTPFGDRFINSGYWNEASNWQSGSVPAVGSDVVIAANAIVPSGYVADAGNVLVQPNASVTMKDGAQLVHNNTIRATMEKSIEGYEDMDNESGWYSIASPVEGDYSTDGLTVGEYDLYLYHEPSHYWYNSKYETNSFNTLTNGQGYFYANIEDRTLTFSGQMPSTEACIVEPLSYAASGRLKGYNLVGNPFTRSLTLGDVEVGNETLTTYLVAENSSEFTVCHIASRPIKPGEGFFVQASAENQNVVFNSATASRSSKATQQPAFICIEASNNDFTDRAYVQFEKGNTLHKMDLRDKQHKVYVMQDGEKFASTTIDQTEGEIPVNFEVVKNGTYSISVGVKGIKVEYLHLIDHLTGADVDLLATPTYTFKANTSDYASRFRLVFSSNNNGIEEAEEVSSASFAYFDGSRWMVNNSGQATLQVIDVMGRVLSSETLNGNAEVSINQPAGIYMLRLLNGDNVKVQKVVVQ